MTTAEQRLAALETANGRRFAHATTRSHLRSLNPRDSRREAAAILRDPEGELRHMRARYLLESITRFGPVRLGKLIRRTGLGAGRLAVRLGELTDRERHLLAESILDLDCSQAGAELTPAERHLVGEVFARLTHHGPDFQAVAEKCQDLVPRDQQADGHGPVPHPDRSGVRPLNGRPDTAPGVLSSLAPGADTSTRRRWRG